MTTLQGTLIELYELYLAGNFSDVPDYRFTNGTNELGTNMVWKGNEYRKLPVEASGFDLNGQGKLPRPGIKIANVDQWIGVIARANNDLIRAKFERHRTFAKYLDAVNFINGNPTADPAQEIPVDVFYVEQKQTETREYIEWVLVAACDLAGKKLPGRPMLSNICGWRKTTQCPFVRTCNHTMSNCKSNFGETAPLIFGGFPGVGYRRG